MIEKAEAIKIMITEVSNSKNSYAYPEELAMRVADMLDLWDKDENENENLPEWLINEAVDIWDGNY